MEIEVKSVKLNKEDVSLLLSDATCCGDFYVTYVGDEEEIENFLTEMENECLEDCWAEWLVRGGKLEINGNDTDDKNDEDYDTDIVGVIGLDTINKRFTDAVNDKSVKGYVDDFISENDDWETGYNLLQYIAFGEIILG